MPSRGPNFDLVITDLDNTVYDWEAFFIPAFMAMRDAVERISAVPREDLERSFRRVYQRHRTSEYAFVLQEAEALRDVDAGLSPAAVFAKYDEAIHAFRSLRKKGLRLYPSVRDTLVALKAAGVKVVAHSDSPMEYVSRRLRQLDVDQLFDAICAPRDHGVPAGLEHLVRQAPESTVGARTRLIESNPELRKPDPRTLAPVFAAFPVSLDRILYVGDNLSRDVLLAQRAGISATWARYGAVHDPVLREQLYRITYWTDADVAAEERLRKELGQTPPTFEIESFDGLREIVGV